jgi:hypothetical protein
MLSVIYKPCMLRDVKLDVVMLSVVMLNDVAPNKIVKFAKKREYIYSKKSFMRSIAVFFISL